MATRTVIVGERKAELEALVVQSQAAQRRVESEFAKLENSLAATATDLATLEVNHTEACRREALGERSDRAKIESDISTMSARQKGLRKLIAEQREKIAAITKERDPIETELRQIERAEFVARERAVIENLFTDGREEIETRNRLVDSFAHRLVALRNYEDPELKSLAFDYAYKLQCQWEGRRP